eukprot:TRINITY_DN9030_c0_g3_i6.p1 TRINITY_DN9030_c0_g3~~TRINITY_DN9030_c0_g3_i6.p1  ORF type:complete len:1236 (+),score=233.94 TRINITY_DN9030_c0_g3_i6:84-3791(+)
MKMKLKLPMTPSREHAGATFGRRPSGSPGLEAPQEPQNTLSLWPAPAAALLHLQNAYSSFLSWVKQARLDGEPDAQCFADTMRALTVVISETEVALRSFLEHDDAEADALAPAGCASTDGQLRRRSRAADVGERRTPPELIPPRPGTQNDPGAAWRSRAESAYLRQYTLPAGAEGAPPAEDEPASPLSQRRGSRPAAPPRWSGHRGSTADGGARGADASPSAFPPAAPPAAPGAAPAPAPANDPASDLERGVAAAVNLVTEAVAYSVSAERGALYLSCQGQGAELHKVACVGPHPASSALTVLRGQGVAGVVAASGVGLSAHSAGGSEHVADLQTSSVLALPLKGTARPGVAPQREGSLLLMNRLNAPGFTEEDEALAASAAELLHFIVNRHTCDFARLASAVQRAFSQARVLYAPPAGRPQLPGEGPREAALLRAAEELHPVRHTIHRVVLAAPRAHWSAEDLQTQAAHPASIAHKVASAASQLRWTEDAWMQLAAQMSDTLNDRKQDAAEITDLRHRIAEMAAAEARHRQAMTHTKDQVAVLTRLEKITAQLQRRRLPRDELSPDASPPVPRRARSNIRGGAPSFVRAPSSCGVPPQPPPGANVLRASHHSADSPQRTPRARSDGSHGGRLLARQASYRSMGTWIDRTDAQGQGDTAAPPMATPVLPVAGHHADYPERMGTKASCRSAATSGSPRHSEGHPSRSSIGSSAAAGPEPSQFGFELQLPVPQLTVPPPAPALAAVAAALAAAAVQASAPPAAAGHLSATPHGRRLSVSFSDLQPATPAAETAMPHVVSPDSCRPMPLSPSAMQLDTEGQPCDSASQSAAAARRGQLFSGRKVQNKWNRLSPTGSDAASSDTDDPFASAERIRRRSMPQRIATSFGSGRRRVSRSMSVAAEIAGMVARRIVQISESREKQEQAAGRLVRRAAPDSVIGRLQQKLDMVAREGCRRTAPSWSPRYRLTPPPGRPSRARPPPQPPRGSKRPSSAASGAPVRSMPHSPASGVVTLCTAPPPVPPTTPPPPPESAPLPSPSSASPTSEPSGGPQRPASPARGEQAPPPDRPAPASASSDGACALLEWRRPRPPGPSIAATRGRRPSGKKRRVSAAVRSTGREHLDGGLGGGGGPRMYTSRPSMQVPTIVLPQPGSQSPTVQPRPPSAGTPVNILFAGPEQWRSTSSSSGSVPATQQPQVLAAAAVPQSETAAADLPPRPPSGGSGRGRPGSAAAHGRAPRAG